MTIHRKIEPLKLDKDTISVLLLDDEKTVRDTFASLCKEYGMKPLVASNATEAFDSINREYIDVVITDLKMPKIDGIEFLKRVRKLDPDIPVIILTAYASLDSAIKAIELNAYDYVQKPISNIPAFMHIIKHAAEYYRSLRKSRELIQKIEQNEALLQTLFKNMTEAVLLVEVDPSGAPATITTMNPAAEKLIGKLHESKKNIIECIAIPHRDIFLSAWHKTIELSSCIIEVTICNEKGEKIPVECSLSRIRWYESIKILIVIRSIKERVNLHQAVSNIAEHYRRNVGQEIHDTLGQNLVSAELIVKLINDKLNKEHSSALPEVAILEQLIKKTVNEAKKIALLEFPFELDENERNLPDVIKRMVMEKAKSFDINCNVEIDIQPDAWPDKTMALQLYRIIQEAVTNSIVHGKAKNIKIELKCSKDNGRLFIEDDGKGIFNKNFGHKGLGIQIMQYRASLFGGRIKLENTSKGTIMKCKW